MLIMVTYWLNRAADLIRYQLLILRTHAQFGDLAWCSYEAFRRDAAARQVTNWSAMHVELYNFHTSAATRLLYLNLRWVGIPRKHGCFFWYDYLPVVEHEMLCGVSRSLSLPSSLRSASLSGKSPPHSLP